MSYFVAEPLLPFEEFTAAGDDNRRLLWVLSVLPDERLLLYLEQAREGHRDAYPQRVLWRCLIAKLVYQIKTYAELIRELWRNGSLRQVVGIEGTPPRDYHFSRFLKRLSQPLFERLLAEMFHQLVARLAEALPELGAQVAVDGTAVHAYSNERKARRGKASDPDAQWGARTQTEVKPPSSAAEGASAKRPPEKRKAYWFGYVVELLVDCAAELPLGFQVTPANESETLEFRPLLRELAAEHPEVAGRTKVVVADKGYDSRENCEHVLRELKALPIIKMRRRLKGDEIDQSAECCCTELGTPICQSGHKMIYWGRDGDDLKWRCPAKVGKHPVRCTFRGGCGTPSKYGRVLKVSIWEDARRWPGIWRESHRFKRLYKQRTAAERVNSRLKQHLLLDDLTIRGLAKVKVHVGLGLLVMLAGAWAMVQADRKDRMRRTVRLAA